MQIYADFMNFFRQDYAIYAEFMRFYAIYAEFQVMQILCSLCRVYAELMPFMQNLCNIYAGFTHIVLFFARFMQFLKFIFSLCAVFVQLLCRCYADFLSILQPVRKSIDCLIGFNMFLVRFLGRKCFIQPLLSSDYSINLRFNDMLEQQGVGLKKLLMCMCSLSLIHI